MEKDILVLTRILALILSFSIAFICLFVCKLVYLVCIGSSFATYQTLQVPGKTIDIFFLFKITIAVIFSYSVFRNKSKRKKKKERKKSTQTIYLSFQISLGVSRIEIHQKHGRLKGKGYLSLWMSVSTANIRVPKS